MPLCFLSFVFHLNTYFMKKTKMNFKKLALDKQTISILESIHTVGGNPSQMSCVSFCQVCNYTQPATCAYCFPTGAGELTCSPSCTPTISATPGVGCAGI